MLLNQKLNQLLFCVSALSLHSKPTTERFVLGVLTDKEFAVGPYLGEHRGILKKMAPANTLWAGELRIVNGEIVEANETSGLLARNGVKSNVEELRHNGHFPMAKTATLHTFSPEAKHIFPMFEKGLTSENFRHDLRNQLTRISGIAEMIYMYMHDDNVIEKPLEMDNHFTVDFKVFRLMEAMLPSYFDNRTNQGIHKAQEYGISNEGEARLISYRLEQWFLGQRPMNKMQLKTLAHEVSNLVRFLAQEPREEVEVFSI